jgi:hypothetical protein
MFGRTNTIYGSFTAIGQSLRLSRILLCCFTVPSRTVGARNVEPLIYLIYAAAGLTIFFGLLPLVVSIAYRGNPPPHIANMLERFVEVSVFGASSIFSPLRFIKPNGENPKK